MGNKNSKWYILLILAVVWGSSFILMKKGLDGGMNAYQLGAYRILFTSLFLGVFFGKEFFKIPSTKFKYIFLAGLLGNFFPIFLFALAQTQISSSISSTLNSFTPLNTLIIGSLFFGLTFSRKQILGLLIGIVGCLLLVYAGASGNPSKNYWFALLVIVATWCYAANINMVKKYLSDVSPLGITVGNFAFLLLPAIGILLYNGFDFQTIHQLSDGLGFTDNIHPLIYVAILGIVGTGLANIYFYRLIQMSSPIFASNVTYLIPIVATIWSMIFNEGVTLLQVLGTIIILFGVYITNRK